MPANLSRRALLASAVAGSALTGSALVAGATSRSAAAADPRATRASGASDRLDLSDLETRFDARIGLFAAEVGSRRRVSWRATKRFAFCSTYKALAGAAVLRETSTNGLDRVIRYSRDDLVDYSPVTEQHVDEGMTLGAIAEAAIRQSDNTAGNLLFRELGGPSGFERALRARGDRQTRSDRIETELNSAVPGETRDTSDAETLARDLSGYLFGGWLCRGDAATLRSWMSGNATGNALIRAGVPSEWTVADKSGAGSYGTRNDIAAVFRPGERPLVIAVLSTRSAADASYDNALVAEATRRAVGAWA